MGILAENFQTYVTIFFCKNGLFQLNLSETGVEAMGKDNIRKRKAGIAAKGAGEGGQPKK
jgi:hypothetical protein